MKTTLKNNLLNFSLVFLLTLVSFNSCSKDEIISTPQKQGQIKVEIKESIDNVDLKNQIEKNLSKIKQLFEIAPPKSMRKFNGKSARNDTILEHIQVNTEAYNSIENRNGKVSYTFQVDFPSDSTNEGEIINLHTYYDENNQLKSQLIKYELTNEELLVATNNQSFDGFWDKISYLDLETTEIDSNSKRNTSARSGDPCPCEGGGSTTTVTWVPYPNNSGYGGSSSGTGGSGTQTPFSVIPISLQKLWGIAHYSAYYPGSNYVGPTCNCNYTIPVRYFSTNDLIIPAYNPSSSGTPFNNYYAYYFSGIKNIISDYYEKVYVSQINSYVTSSQTTLEDHIVKQKAVYDFFKFTYELYAQNRTQFYYLSSNHELTKSIFNFLAENNTGSFYQYNQAKTFSKSAIEILLGGYNDLTIDELLEVLEFEQDYRNKMSDSEIDLFDTLTRDEQLNYLWSAKQASDKTEELFSTYCEKYNGKGDAFRHAYWNALSSSRIGVGLTNLLTTRHEDKPPTYPYNSKENAMDLYNNEIGRDIIWNGSTDILQDVLSAFNNGDLRYLSNQASDCRATFNSQLTPTNQ